MYRGFVLIFIGLTLQFGAVAQTVETAAAFLKDSVKIGMPVGYAVTSKYPAEKDLLFPDSTAGFQNFEYSSKMWFPTKTINGISTDSAIYYVRTFEIDSIQSLSLNLIELVDGDSLIHHFPPDSVALIHTVATIPDSLSAIFLQEDTDLARVPKLFNYPFYSAFLLLALATLGIVWILFGKKIKNAIGARRLRKNYERFILEYDMLMDKIREESIHDDSEIVLSYWKKYMERLEKLPYRKMTTKEISELKSEKYLTKALREVDKAIYASAKLSEIQANFGTLKSYSQNKFEEELNRIQHGVSN